MRNEGGGFSAQDDEKRCPTPALPSEPVEPAPLFHPIKGQHAPRATPENHAKNAMLNNDHLIFAFNLPRGTCSSHRSDRETLSQLSFMP